MDEREGQGAKKTCTYERPMPVDAIKARWTHPDARNVAAGLYECPDCGHTWRDETAERGRRQP